MRRISLAIAVIVGLAGVAAAGPSPAAEPTLIVQADPGDSTTDQSALPVWMQDPAPGSRMRKPEVRHGGPSGFWTSTRPARGGAYRYRMMLVGLVVLGITIFFVVRLLRRTSAERPTRAWPR